MPDLQQMAGSSKRNKMCFCFFLPSMALGSGGVMVKRRAISASSAIREEVGIRSGNHQIDQGTRALEGREQRGQRQGGVRL